MKLQNVTVNGNALTITKNRSLIFVKNVQKNPAKRRTDVRCANCTKKV